MKKLQTLVILGLIVAIIFAGRYLSEIESTLPVITSSGPEAPPQMNPAHAKDFSDLIRKEAESMSRWSDKPAEVKKRLKELASQVREEQLPILQEKALNQRLPGDERFLSVYVLGESTLAKAQESLEQIAASPIPQLKESRLKLQEEILRGQAIESLREPDSLKRVLASAENKFIVDRAQRALTDRESKMTNHPESLVPQTLPEVFKADLDSSSQ